MSSPTATRIRSTGEKTVHLLAVATCFLTLCLLFVGAMVTSTGSGLAVPDWPTTYGQNMFTYPVHKWQGGILYEHGHRLFASGVGMLTVALAVCALIWEKRRWLKGLSVAALAMVIVQGILGGLTVRYQLPVAVSSAHGGLAQLFFCALVWMAWATSASWQAGPWRPTRMANWALVLLGLTYAQTLLGAVMRHSHYGLAIPTFPKAFGEWLPPFWSSGVAMNFVHTRVAPLILAAGYVALALRLLRQKDARPGLAFLLIAVMALQIALGIFTVVSGRLPWLASLHLAGGALTFGVLFSMVLWSGKGVASLGTEPETKVLETGLLPAAGN